MITLSACWDDIITNIEDVEGHLELLDQHEMRLNLQHTYACIHFVEMFNDKWISKLLKYDEHRHDHLSPSSP